MGVLVVLKTLNLRLIAANENFLACLRACVLLFLKKSLGVYLCFGLLFLFLFSVSALFYGCCFNFFVWVLINLSHKTCFIFFCFFLYSDYNGCTTIKILKK